MWKPHFQIIKQALIDAFIYIVTGVLIRLFLLYESTMDVRAWGTENLRLMKRRGERPLLVLWHGKGFIPIAYFHHERLCLYASHSRDPNYGKLPRVLRWLTLRMIERMGYKVLDASQFASESRGVLQFVQTLRDGQGGIIAADGPQGPIYQAKPGACFLAKKTGVMLLPVGAAISSGWQLDQWDRFEIPRMFCRASVVVEEPIFVPASVDDTALEKQRLELEDALNRATRRAETKLQGFSIRR
ncbi:MAG TPA: DUF374 domain-containing protein [Chthonomonadales bacterium]|nr:DUF374 domain-containing protein [Chthonomonadales bacterium]